MDDFQDLVRLIEQRPEWRAELRRLVLTEELLELPALVRQLVEAQARTEERLDALAGQVQQLAEAQARTEQNLASLTARMDQLAARMDELAARMDELAARMDQLVEAQMRTQRELANLAGDVRGFRLEWRYRERASAYFGPLLRGLRVHAPSAVVDEYEDRLPRDGIPELLRADLVVQGQPRRYPERGQIWLVVEVSATVDSHDLERALLRARMLREAGLKVLPVVAGEHATQTAVDGARAERAVLLQDGRVAGWDEAIEAWAT